MPKKTILVLMLLLGFSLPAWAEFKVNLEAGYLYGDSTYQIGGVFYGSGGYGATYFPISELEFPLDSWIAKAGFEAQVDRLTLSAEIMTDIYPVQAEMKDSDWVVSATSLDSFSESDTESNLFSTDLNANIRVLGTKRLSFDLALGYTYQQFTYDCKDTAQYSPSGTNIFGTGIIPGKTISYEIEYHIPYVEVGMRTEQDNFNLAMSLGLAPYVKVYDCDDHWRRPKTMDGELEGHAYLANLSAGCRLTPHVDLSLGVVYKKIEAKGEQKQFGLSSGNASYLTIEEEVESEQLRSTLGLTFCF